MSSGSSRLSYADELIDAGAPAGPTTPYCPYCKRLMLLLGEAGIAYESVLIDLSDVPQWYKEAYAPGTCPAVQGLEGFCEGDAWNGGYDEASAWLAENDERVKRVVARHAPESKQDVLKASERVVFGGVGLMLLAARGEGARGFLAFCVNTCFGDDEEGKAGAQAVLEGSAPAKADEDPAAALSAGKLKIRLQGNLI